MWLLNDPLLAVSVEQHLHPELRQRLGALRAAASTLVRRDFNIKRLPRAEREAIQWLEQHRVPYTAAYTVPFLSPAYADRLQAEVHRVPSGFAPNSLEDKAYQIPEWTTQDQCPQLFRALRELHDAALAPVWMLIQGRTADVYNTIQFAQYNPKGTAHGNWHHDEDSDQTTVVSLNPEQFSGGGTQLRTSSVTYADVPPLDKGHALLFSGKTVLHRGLNVDAGTRNILVYWCEYRAECRR